MHKRRRAALWWPESMRMPPRLREDIFVGPREPNYVLLINPFYPKDPVASFAKHVLTPSLALTSLAGATPPHWTVRYWDENLLQGHPPYAPFPSVVGITVHLTFARRAYDLARWYRRRGAKVILGGLHATSCPEEAAVHADAIAVGEGIQLWPRILRDIETGRIEPRYEGSYRVPYREDPFPLRSLLPRRMFLTTTSLIATRGCHNRCAFCYLSTDGLQMPYLAKDPDRIAEELRLDRQPYGVFTDNNLGSKPEYLRALCRALRPLGKIWSAAISIDICDHPSLIRDMADSGCLGVFIGFESLSGENLDDARKKSPHPDDYARRVDILHRHGIQVNGSFVFGFDHDRRDVFERTVRWIEKTRLECATFHILTPYPGTPLFRQLDQENRLLHKNWHLYDTAHAVFSPQHMSPVELEEGYAWAYDRLFSLASIWRRRPEHVLGLPPYLIGSLLYKKCNRIWPLVIRLGLTGFLWRPLIEASRLHHLLARRRGGSRRVGGICQSSDLPSLHCS